MRAATNERAGSEFDAGPEYRPSDEDLGVGVADESVATAVGDGSQIAELLQRPEIAAAVEAMVAAKLKEREAGGPVPVVAVADEGMAKFVSLMVAALDKHSAVFGSQQPGYIKPLPVEEVDARAAAYREMLALLQRAVETRMRPMYLLKQPFYAEEILWPEGDTIYWLGPPTVEMEPQNEIARQISEKMWRWIGNEVVPIEEQVEDAMRERHGMVASTSAPEVPLFREPRAAGVAERVGHVAGVERQTVRPSRVAGTLVPEIPGGARGIVGSVQPGAMPSPLQSF